MTIGEYVRLVAQIAILKEVQADYQGQAIDNIIRQMEARLNVIKTNYHEH